MNFCAMIDALSPTCRSQRTAIELFARDGKMATSNWSDSFNSITGIDVNQSYLDQFAKNIPNSTIICMDSIDGIRSGKLFKTLKGSKFDLVSADSPQGFYGNNYCEHFDIIHHLYKLSKPGGFFHFNINLFPYKPNNLNEAKDNYGMSIDDFDKWMIMRKQVYCGKEVLNIDEAISHYIKEFTKQNCFITAAAWYLRKSSVPDHPDHILYLLLQRN